jgi:hypothetical protein
MARSLGRQVDICRRIICISSLVRFVLKERGVLIGAAIIGGAQLGGAQLAAGLFFDSWMLVRGTLKFCVQSDGSCSVRLAGRDKPGMLVMDIHNPPI